MTPPRRLLESTQDPQARAILGSWGEELPANGSWQRTAAALGLSAAALSKAGAASAAISGAPAGAVTSSASALGTLAGGTTTGEAIASAGAVTAGGAIASGSAFTASGAIASAGAITPGAAFSGGAVAGSGAVVAGKALLGVGGLAKWVGIGFAGGLATIGGAHVASENGILATNPPNGMVAAATSSEASRPKYGATKAHSQRKSPAASRRAITPEAPPPAGTGSANTAKPLPDGLVFGSSEREKLVERPLPGSGKGEAPTEPSQGPVARHSKSSSHADSVAAEIALIDRARREVSQGQPLAALKRLDRYEATARTTLLSPEATMLRIQALQSLGRVTEARSLAARYLRKTPRGPKAARLRRYLEATALKK